MQLSLCDVLMGYFFTKTGFALLTSRIGLNSIKVSNLIGYGTPQFHLYAIFPGNPPKSYSQ